MYKVYTAFRLSLEGENKPISDQSEMFTFVLFYINIRLSSIYILLIQT